MEDIIKTVTEFGIALIENPEHVPIIKRIADTAYEYLKRKGVNLDRAKKVKAELINHGKDLFVQAWMTSEENEEPLGEEDRREAKRTFDELLRGE
jgi:hypothetical protein